MSEKGVVKCQSYVNAGNSCLGKNKGELIHNTTLAGLELTL